MKGGIDNSKSQGGDQFPPLPGEDAAPLPGLAFTRCRNSASVLTGKAGPTTSTVALLASARAQVLEPTTPAAACRWQDRAREHLLGLFGAVGNDDPRVLKGRQNLASALF